MIQPGDIDHEFTDSLNRRIRRARNLATLRGLAWVLGACAAGFIIGTLFSH